MLQMGKYDIVVGFDGTCVKDRYPLIGDNIGAQPILLRLIEKGHDVILFTKRTNLEQLYANRWFGENGIDHKISYWPKKPYPSNYYGQSSRPQIYIDCNALGCPVIHPRGGEKPYVDWSAVELLLTQKGII